MADQPTPPPSPTPQLGAGMPRVDLSRVVHKLSGQLADANTQIAMLQVLAEAIQEENDALRAELVQATGGEKGG